MKKIIVTLAVISLLFAAVPPQKVVETDEDGLLTYNYSKLISTHIGGKIRIYTSDTEWYDVIITEISSLTAEYKELAERLFIQEMPRGYNSCVSRDTDDSVKVLFEQGMYGGIVFKNKYKPTIYDMGSISKGGDFLYLRSFAYSELLDDRIGGRIRIHWPTGWTDITVSEIHALTAQQKENNMLRPEEYNSIVCHVLGVLDDENDGVVGIFDKGLYMGRVTAIETTD
jgi:hypothetical protein